MNWIWFKAYLSRRLYLECFHIIDHARIRHMIIRVMDSAYEHSRMVSINLYCIIKSECLDVWTAIYTLQILNFVHICLIWTKSSCPSEDPSWGLENIYVLGSSAPSAFKDSMLFLWNSHDVMIKQFLSFHMHLLCCIISISHVVH